MTVPSFVVVFGKGDQRVELPVADQVLRDYYAGDGWTDLSEVAPGISVDEADPELPVPSKSAAKPEWVAYVAALHPELDEDEVEDMTVAELQRVVGVD